MRSSLGRIISKDGLITLVGFDSSTFEFKQFDNPSQTIKAN